MKHALWMALMLAGVSTSVLAGVSASAEFTLGNVALYNRCYAQITGERPSSSTAQSQQVAAGTLSPVTACMTVLNSAVLSGQSGVTISNVNDTQAKKVLAKFNNLHASWLYRQDFTQVLSIYSLQGTRDYVDSTTPALYLTRALFQSTPNASSILANSDILRAVRTNEATATGPSSRLEQSQYQFVTPEGEERAGTWGWSGQIFASTGDLLGARPIAPVTINATEKYPDQHDTRRPDDNSQLFPGDNFQHEIYKSAGGGLIGNYSYILMNATLPESYFADGGVQMPRRWGRSVFTDTLCRDLPAVRQADAAPFVSATSTVPFRRAASCVVCHASMDRAAMVVRNFINFSSGIGSGGSPGIDSLKAMPIRQPAENAWPVTEDKVYFERPTNGVFYFRNYKGELIDVPVNSPTALANQIVAQDDFYICLAKRYYQYFTGVSADIGDLGDPAHGTLNAADLAQRNIVIALGLNLKSTKNLRQLIQEIMNLPQYKQSGFGQ